MDMVLSPDSDGNKWRLTDLLGRPMGTIVEQASSQFVLELEGKALETLGGLSIRGLNSLDDVLRAIERHTRSVCRRS